MSLKLFKLFFLTDELTGVTDKEVYKCIRNSYFGGFTQSFWVGESMPEDRIMYLDYNSMYPSVMAKIRFPTNMNWFKFQNYGNRPKIVCNLRSY